MQASKRVASIVLSAMGLSPRRRSAHAMPSWARQAARSRRASAAL